MPSPDASPFTLTATVLWLLADIAAEVGRLTALTGKGAVPLLRRDNRIRSVHASLAIKNNTLSLEQVTAVFAGKRVLGPPHEIHSATDGGEQQGVQVSEQVLRMFRESSTRNTTCCADRRPQISTHPFTGHAAAFLIGPNSGYPQHIGP